MSATKIFCEIDDFCQNAAEAYKMEFPGETPEPWPSELSLSEVMTIAVLFHNSSGFREFKYFYINMCRNMRGCFPKLVSYNRFIELMKLALVPLYLFMQTRTGGTAGISFIDSTKIVACHNKRIKNNIVFNGLAQIGKTSTGWFYGFKLHLIVNEFGEILSFSLTSGNIDDRKPVPELTKGLWGKLIGDKGYISQKLSEKLQEEGIQLITYIKQGMKNKLIHLKDKILLRKRSIIETINDLLKNSCQIEHTRHRNIQNFLVNLLSALIAYTYREKLPAINFTQKERVIMNPCENCLIFAN
jgi:hypothetical protein